jgi:hypothetical protein
MSSVRSASLKIEVINGQYENWTDAASFVKSMARNMSTRVRARRPFEVADAGVRQGVIVQAVGPRPTVELDQSVLGTAQGRRPRRVVYAPEEQAEMDDVMQRLHDFLQRIVGQEPVAVVHGFALEVTSDELAEIARSPLVREISPNRLHKRELHLG